MALEPVPDREKWVRGVWIQTRTGRAYYVRNGDPLPSILPNGTGWKIAQAIGYKVAIRTHLLELLYPCPSP